MYSSPNSGLTQLEYLKLYPGLLTRPQFSTQLFCFTQQHSIMQYRSTVQLDQAVSSPSLRETHSLSLYAYMVICPYELHEFCLFFPCVLLVAIAKKKKRSPFSRHFPILNPQVQKSKRLQPRVYTFETVTSSI